MTARKGFTLIELLVGTVVMAILGTILARMLVQDSRFVSRLEAMMDARQSARAAMNSMAVELRMVSTNGLIDASPTMIDVRAPYAWGIACARDGGDTIASLIPADPMWYASAIPDGVAWLNAAGDYAFQDFASPADVASSGNSGACTGEGVVVLADGELIAIDGLPTVAFGGPAPGTVLYLYQEVSYSFEPSVAMSGRIALWRETGNTAAEEILAPFDSTAGFRFYLDPSAAPQVNPPADLNTVTGLELRLHGESAIAPEGSTDYEDFHLQTRVTFLNLSN